MTAPVKLLARPSNDRPSSTEEGAPLRAGFVLYVGLDQEPPDSPTASGDLAEVAETLRDLARDLLPTAETFTALSLVPTAAAPDEVGTLRDRLSRLAPLPDAGASRHGAPTGHGVDPDDGAPTAADGAARDTAPVPGGAPPPRATPSDAAGTGSAPEPRVRVDLAARRVSVDGRAVALTFMELELLVHLLRSTNRVVGREELLRSVWRGNGRPGTRTIDVHVRRLRAKVPDVTITTVRRVGYRVEPAAAVELTAPAEID